MAIFELVGANGVFSVNYNTTEAEPTVGKGVEVELMEIQYNHMQGMKYGNWLWDMLLDIDNLKDKDEYIFDWLERVILEHLNTL